MNRPLHSAEAIIIPVAGIANVGHGKFSSAALHFLLLRTALKQRTNLPVSQPIIPVGMGVFKSHEAIYTQFEIDVSRASTAFPEARKILVGHSLGGILARRYVAEHESTVLVTIGTPHAGVSKVASLGLFKGQTDAIAAFVGRIPDLQGWQAGGPWVLQFATHRDELIPPGSALTPLQTSGAALHFTSSKSDDRVIRNAWTTHKTLLPDDHISMLTSPQSVDIISREISMTLASTAGAPSHRLPIRSLATA